MRQDIRSLDPNFATKDPDSNVLWFDLQRLTIEGRGWTDTDTPYDRLPSRAKGKVRQPVWDLSQHSAGMAARFVTDATTISARWSLRFESLAMAHMPSTGVSGIDLYAKIGGPGKTGPLWNWAGIGVPSKYPDNSVKLIDGAEPAAEPREFIAYLPLYNGVTKVEIGVPASASIAPAPPRSGKPMCFYGTSIVHGGCAARPGTAYPAIIGRMLDRAHYNLGFSGNGPMDLEMPEFLAELDASVYVLDGLPNMGGATMVIERAGSFVRALRKVRPSTPIVLVENIIYENAALVPSRRVDEKNVALKTEFEKLIAAGVPNLHYVPSENMLGHDSDSTVDGVHPTDLGFMRMAEALAPVIRRLV